jgi:preprotein translocase subunit SecB
MAPLSPLQLKEHSFTNVRVKCIADGSPTASPSLKQSIWFDAVANTTNQWRLTLTIEVTNENPQKPFLYEAEIQIQGTVEVGNEFPSNKREQLALVNGLSVLYSAAREMLLNITSRSAHGGLNLPTLSFVKLVDDALKQKAEQDKNAEPATKPAPAPAPAAP